MDIILTVIGWVIGLYVAFMLILAIGFSLGGAANTGNSDLSIMSIASTFLLFYLIYKGFTFFFGSDDIDTVKSNKTPVIRTVQYDTPVIDIPSTTPPVTKEKIIPEQTKATPLVHKEKVVTKVKKGYFDGVPYIPWIIYSLVLLFYVYWIFKPATKQQTEKELVKKKLIATMMFKKDVSGRQAWHPSWEPDNSL